MAYLMTLLAVVAGASAYSLRVHGIFGCQAAEYGTDRYLAYCNTQHYGDYDHGVFWFGLEPQAVAAAASADVLFIGNSRMQFGLSAPATDRGFKALGLRYYLLGFAHNGNYLFLGPLLDRLRPSASVYVVNVDLFFEQVETPPARAVMYDADARSRYEQRRNWQYVHAPACNHVPALCGHAIAFYRAPLTGAWTVTGRGFRGEPVSYHRVPDPRIVDAYVRRGRDFLASLPARKGCVILTTIPTVNTGMGTARAIAEALGLPLVAPEVPGLDTFDGSHLDPRSAELWSKAFIEAAEPRIRECVENAAAVRAAVPR